jgi:flagellar motor switch protein FliM
MSETPVQSESAKVQAGSQSPDGPIYAFDGRRMDAQMDRATIQPYDFHNPGPLRQEDLRRLELLHQKLAEHLCARLSTFLRMECMVKLLKFGDDTFSHITESMKAFSHVTLFQVEFLRGIGILDMSLPLSLAIADRLLGGKGRLSETDRGLTEIEIALLEDFVQLVLVEWTHQWPEQELSFAPSIIGHDSSGRFLHTGEADVIHIMVNLEVVFGECVGQIQLFVPFAMIEPIVKLMTVARLKPADSRSRSIEWRQPFDTINVPVLAEWFVKDIAVSDVLLLRPGDVLEMDRQLIARTHVKLSNTTGFIGTAGIENGRVAVQLTQRKTTE